MLWTLLVVIILAVLAISRFHLKGQDLGKYDTPLGQRFNVGGAASDGLDDVLASMSVGAGPIMRAPRRERMGLMREYMDGMGDVDLPASFTPVNASGVSAEWVVTPGADSSRRVLYIHGGAFVMGSPKSHRIITSRFSEIYNAAVLAIDYRLMPEYARLDGVDDCRTAYRWILDNGPQGPGVADKLFVAGDSAGGNLTLSTIAWARDQGLRAPEGAIALSPVTDLTMGSPSLKSNMETDAMLGPMFAPLAKVPRTALLWFGWLQARKTPASPTLSPIFGDLSGLPPVLVQASESEMLYDDCRRYVNRAAEAGTPARLQSWPHMVHVWQLFYPQLSEAVEAWDEIGKFMHEVG
jgi:epsilon-lactone hydrolase